MFEELKNIIKNSIKYLGNITIGQIELLIIKHDNYPTLPPVFIVGHPRSGTTLLYQILSAHLKFVYFSNLSAWIPYFPLFSTAVFKIFSICDPKPLYESQYGFSKGWRQPHPGYFFWKKIFQLKTGEMKIHVKSETSLKQLIGSVAFLTNLYNRPFLNKWTPNSVRIKELSEYFPNALFIILRRDLRDVAQSQIRARITTRGNVHRPFVTWPLEFQPSKTEDFIENIVSEIKIIEERIDKSLFNLDDNRFLEIRYSALCEDPLAQLKKITQFYLRNSGENIKIRKLDVLPDHFLKSNSIKIGLDDYSRLTNCMKEMELID